MGFDRSRRYCGTGVLEGSLGADDLTLRSSVSSTGSSHGVSSYDIVSLADRLIFVYSLTLMTFSSRLFAETFFVI